MARRPTVGQNSGSAIAVGAGASSAAAGYGVTRVGTDRRSRYAVGAFAGAAIGGAASAAAGYAVNAAGTRIAQTKTVSSLTARLAKAAPGLFSRLPMVGRIGAIGLGVYSLYEVSKPLVAYAQERREKKAETIAEAQERLGKKFGGSPNDLKLAAENDRAAMAKAKSQKVREAHERRALAAEAEYKRRTGVHIGPTAPDTSPAAPPAAPTAAPQGSIWNDVKGLFSSQPNPELAERRESLMRTRRLLEKNLEKEQSSGFGPRSEAARRALDDNQSQLTALAKEERDANPFKQGFQTFAPLGALLGGYALGAGVMAGTGKLKAAAEKTAAGVDKLGRAAAKVLNSRPRSVIAGTPTGDRAKALVNEAYAIGGAKPAFASPGYPSTKASAQQIFSGAGRAKGPDYVPAAINLATGAAAFGASFVPGQPEGLRQAERIAGVFEIALGVGQIKALSTAAAIRPGATAVAAIEGLRNRIVRETATRAPAGVAITAAARNAHMARIQATRATSVAGIRADAAVKGEAIRASGRAAAARLSSQKGALKAGADVGVIKARGAERVAIAEQRAKTAMQPKYKDTWQDSRGRVYHRRDKSVRSAANSNAPKRAPRIHG